MKVVRLIQHTRVGPREHFLVLNDRESSTPEEITLQVHLWQDAFGNDSRIEYEVETDEDVMFEAITREICLLNNKIEHLNFRKNEMENYLLYLNHED